MFADTSCPMTAKFKMVSGQSTEISLILWAYFWPSRSQYRCLGWSVLVVVTFLCVSACASFLNIFFIIRVPSNWQIRKHISLSLFRLSQKKSIPVKFQQEHTNLFVTFLSIHVAQLWILHGMKMGPSNVVSKLKCLCRKNDHLFFDTRRFFANMSFSFDSKNSVVNRLWCTSSISVEK